MIIIISYYRLKNPNYMNILCMH